MNNIIGFTGMNNNSLYRIVTHQGSNKSIAYTGLMDRYQIGDSLKVLKKFDEQNRINNMTRSVVQANTPMALIRQSLGL